MPSDTASLFAEHRRSLVDYAARLVGSRAQAEDLVQEAWLRFDEVARQRLLVEPLGYLYRIVRNLAVDAQRRGARERSIFAGIDLDLAAAVSLDRPATPEAKALYRDEIRLLGEALDELPERTRIAFEMHRFGGSKLREIAEFLGISVSLARLLVTDAMQHCKERLGWL